MSYPLAPASLTIDGCHTRQARLIAKLESLRVPVAIIADRRHVHYLTGFWSHQYLPAVVVIHADGRTALICNAKADGLAVDEVHEYEAQRCATMVEDRFSDALHVALPMIEGNDRVGCDELPRPGILQGRQVVGLHAAFLEIRRAKLPDEVAMIRRSIKATEACYDRVRNVIKPGMTEIELAAHVHFAAVEAAGELIDEMGNDFQANTPGGPMRNRAMQAGELVPLDLSVCIRGYTSDMSRTISVDRNPTEKQRKAHELIMGALAHVESTIRPGISCKALYEQVHQMINGQEGWSFSHHLGHGIGLCGHEGPRLNPNWDDTLQAGDVITAEPGLYGADLNNGIRIEQNYLITEDGFELLTESSTDF